MMLLGKKQRALIKSWWTPPTSEYCLSAFWSGGDKLNNQYPIFLASINTVNGDIDRECIISWSKAEHGCLTKISAIEAYIAELDGKWLEAQSSLRNRKEAEA